MKMLASLPLNRIRQKQLWVERAKICIREMMQFVMHRRLLATFNRREHFNLFKSRFLCSCYSRQLLLPLNVKRHRGAKS